jgi:hypothetical protein
LFSLIESLHREPISVTVAAAWVVYLLAVLSPVGAVLERILVSISGSSSISYIVGDASVDKDGCFIIGSSASLCLLLSSSKSLSSPTFCISSSVSSLSLSQYRLH